MLSETSLVIAAEEKVIDRRPLPDQPCQLNQPQLTPVNNGLRREREGQLQLVNGTAGHDMVHPAQVAFITLRLSPGSEPTQR